MKILVCTFFMPCGITSGDTWHPFLGTTCNYRLKTLVVFGIPFIEFVYSTTWRWPVLYWRKNVVKTQNQTLNLVIVRLIKMLLLLCSFLPYLTTTSFVSIQKRTLLAATIVFLFFGLKKDLYILYEKIFLSRLTLLFCVLLKIKLFGLL